MILFNIGIVPPCLNPKLDTDKTIKKSQIKLSYEKVAELVKIPARITWAHGATNITPVKHYPSLLSKLVSRFSPRNSNPQNTFRVFVRSAASPTGRNSHHRKKRISLR